MGIMQLLVLVGIAVVITAVVISIEKREEDDG